MDHDRLTLTVSETARLLGLSRSSAYSLANQGVIPTIRLGRRLVVPKIWLEKILAEAGQPKQS